MKREIQFKTLKTKWGTLLRVSKQTHRDIDFAPTTSEDTNYFCASNGFCFCSVCMPEVSIESDTLYVLGEEKYDNLPVVVPSEEWLKKCFEARDEYNALES